MDDYIPLSPPNIRGNEIKYVTEALEQEWVSIGGPCIPKFEQAFADYAGLPEACALQSGTAALHLALICAGVGAGDLVIAPALTFIAAVNPIRYAGAEPVFMDCGAGLCMDAGKLARYLAEQCERRGGAVVDKELGKPVKAIVVVHVFGNLADMARIMDIAAAYGLKVIEDATEAVGSFYTEGRYKGKMAGTIGHFGCYSFNGNKIITTGGGGMLAAADAADLRRARHLSTQAKSDTLYYRHDDVGYNYRMTNIQAAMGLAQLERLEDFIETKRRNYEYYQELGLPLLPFAAGTRPNYWFYAFESRDRDGLIQHLNANRIQSRPIWGLIHEQPPYRQNKALWPENCAEYYGRVVNLPCGSNLARADVERVAAAVRAFETGRDA